VNIHGIKLPTLKSIDVMPVILEKLCRMIFFRTKMGGEISPANSPLLVFRPGAFYNPSRNRLEGLGIIWPHIPPLHWDTPLKKKRNTIMEVWFRSFSFPNGPICRFHESSRVHSPGN